MPLASGKEILLEAERDGYAVGGFDAFNMESVQGIMTAAEDTRTPIFLQVCIVSLEYAGIGYATALLKEAAKQASVPICLHLDHGPQVTDICQIKECIQAGFKSVMVDASKLSFDENVAITRKVVEMAHALDVCVEGELGQVSRNISASRQEVRSLMTEPDQAARFVEATGVDYLAVSVGSVSGFYKGQIELDIERLKQVREAVNVPLVFHGGTSIPQDQLKKAVGCGVRKVNIAHGVRKAFWDGVSAAASGGVDSKSVDPRCVLDKARDSVRDYVKIKINQLGTSQSKEDN